jgi:diguanylate cyclase (GGDEF)-like protein/putative nucleotidyltransferase with HDIG domain
MNRKSYILIVDDEVFNCELLEGYLELLGYESKTAKSGEEALAMLGPDIDLILLDATMPGLTGFDVARKVREHAEHWNLPIIMVTALSSASDRLRAAEAGANDFICKPVDDTELKVRMTSLLKLKHAQDEVKRHKDELEAKVLERTAELRIANEKLEAISTTDPLTGLPNHRAIIAALDLEMERSQRFGRSFAMLFVDIDHFKSVNDQHGHAAGDIALAAMREIAQGALRGMDMIGRWGGEEFVILLPELDRHSAMSVADRFRAGVADFAFPEKLQDCNMTCSIGVSIYPEDGIMRSDLIQAADRAMYTAKRMGRNQVRSANDPLVNLAGSEVKSRDSSDLEGEVEALAMLVSARDLYTGEHTDSVARLSEQIALELGLNESEAHIVGLVGQLHDIGKIAIPDSILHKPSALNEEEWALMRQHPIVGAEVVERMPTLRIVASAIRGHHESWNGKGYPDGLSGEDIPLAARIVAVADAFGAMTTDRPYRKARGVEWALGELRRCAGVQFDPQIVEILEQIVVGSEELRKAA